MALTTPRGFAGGPMADFDYGVGAAGGAWVEAAAALAVTQPNGGTRTVSIAAGNACAYGVRVTNDAAISQALAAPGSGGAWYLLALRFSWSAKTVTLQVLAGPTTGSTTAPTAIPTVLPGTATSTPGTSYDLPLAWAFVNSANTTVTLFDVRMRTQLNEPIASTLNALRVFAQQFTPITGLMVPVIEGATTWRWGTNSAGVAAWLPWDSDWSASAAFSFTGVSASGGSTRWRYRAGRVMVEFLLIASSNGGGLVFNLLPVQAERTAALAAGGAVYQEAYAITGRAHRRENATGRFYDVAIYLNSDGVSIGFGNVNSAQYMDGLSLGTGDTLRGVFEYDPLTA